MQSRHWNGYGYRLARFLSQGEQHGYDTMAYWNDIKVQLYKMVEQN